MKEKTKEGTNKAAGTAQSLGEKAKQTAQGAWETAKDTTEKIKETVVGKEDEDRNDDREKRMDEDVVELRRRQAGELDDKNKY